MAEALRIDRSLAIPLSEVELRAKPGVLAFGAGALERAGARIASVQADKPLYAAGDSARVAVALSAFYPTVQKIRANTHLRHVIVTNVKEYFPPVLRLRPVLGSLPPRYEVAEALNLQSVRDLARNARFER